MIRASSDDAQQLLGADAPIVRCDDVAAADGSSGVVRRFEQHTKEGSQGAAVPHIVIENFRDGDAVPVYGGSTKDVDRIRPTGVPALFCDQRVQRRSGGDLQADFRKTA
jgi:hypothetical protein